ncbi:DMT family transporter [Gellertiella hungarica]|uniref:Drug/metabolite transporter (DMT)-like permease n=1 Tax=Gellertiella hungarica TaxID=1572859 RepID=A0A7W6J1C9_9HYPH|nr:DMT family transporter [Gellertiella hungarica]MBB4062968.1 drug/metabolite transporter (DMT)-like permease [Gellertiella hungarica]
MTSHEQHQYRLGAFYVAMSALAWSLSGLFVRSITTDLTTLLCVRGMISGTAVFAFFFYLEGARGFAILRSMGWPFVVITFFSAASMISGIGSMWYASVADAMVIYATTPFLTAGVAFLMIREIPSRSTIVAAGVALFGVLIMLADRSGGTGSLFGKFLAFVMAVTVAFMATFMRQHKTMNMLPAMAASAWLCSLSTIWFASPLSVSAHNLGLIFAFAILQNAMGLILYTFGSHRIPAADASLLVSLEVPLTPLWVWLFMSETPSLGTIIGGSVVAIALFSHIAVEMRRNRAPSGATA